MSSVPEHLAELRLVLETTANERLLLALIDEHLASLRTIYRERKSEFTDETIVFLKSLAFVQDSLRELIEAVEEKEWIRTHDDAQEIAARLGELKEHLMPYLVAKRAEKEFREVIVSARSLPFAAIAEGEAHFRNRCSQLEGSKQPCPKCGQKMVLRESQHGYFWGCSLFPKCFSRRWLSGEDFKRLSS